MSTCILQHTLYYSADAVAFSRDGLLLALSTSGNIYILNLTAWALQSTLHNERSSETITELKFSAKGDLLLSAIWSGLSIWRYCPCRETTSVVSYTFGIEDQMLSHRSTAFSFDTKLLVVAMGLSVGIWKFEANIWVHRGAIKLYRDRKLLMILSRCNLLVFGYSDGEIHAWDPTLPTPTLKHTLQGLSSREITALKFAGDGELFASASHDIINLWSPLGKYKSIDQLASIGFLGKSGTKHNLGAYVVIHVRISAQYLAKLIYMNIQHV